MHAHIRYCPKLPINPNWPFPPKELFFFFFFEVSVMSFFVWLLCYCLHIVSTILSIRCFHPHSTESGEVMLLWVEKFLILRYVETQ